ncbi:hypothetical protein [Arthrobacter sp. zg-Y238]|uniref:hypothetical protein n=1 Tax=Arthrobacter sp. zg-Y238 TaxID=2964614 RepID=UPI002101F6DD|nr:hypothetical protein [Arthrobacter sp. zg-Y238]MCQ1954146.1 hypothetical protein [Arthrobacter sp. zg-Y238]
MDLMTSAAAAAALASAVAAFFSWMVAHNSMLAERRRYAASLQADLTTGEVAAARNVIGSWLYGPHVRHSQIEESELIQSYYTVAWAIERLAAGRSALGVLRFSDRRTIATFDKRIKWHVQEQARNLKILAQHIKMDNGDLLQSLNALKEEIPDLDTSASSHSFICDAPDCRRTNPIPEA